MATEKKVVSIIIPTYNRPDILKRAIETCISQTYKDIEIIIVDDTRKSQQEMIDIYRDDRIIYIHNANPQGAPIARNIGISQAKGEYIAPLDDDDEWMPEKIEEQVKILSHKNFHHIGLCVTWMLDKRFGIERINKTPEVINHDYVLDAFNLQSTSAYMFRKDSLIKIARKNINNKVIERMCGRCVIDNRCWEDYGIGIWRKKELRCEKVRKELEKEKQYFDTSLPSAQEYDLAIRISKDAPIISISKVLVIQNATEGQISENWTRKIKGILAIMKKHKEDYKLSHHIKAYGLVAVYSLGYIFGNRIYGLLTYFKERHSG